jgi:hypothetical protein
MWVLWAYCPRRIVALDGQHRGKVEVISVNSTPLLVMLSFRAGIMFSVPGNWSSVRTKMMLGRWTLGDIGVADSKTATSSTAVARSTAVATEASS